MTDAPRPRRPTLLDREGPDAGASLQLRGWLILLTVAGGAIGVLLANLRGVRGWATLAWMAAGALVAPGVTHAVARLAAGAAGRAAGRIYMPGGASTPAVPDFSREDAMAARGDVAGALRSYEGMLAADGERAAVLLRMAGLLARPGGDPSGAAALYQRARRAPGCTAEQDRFATQRLADLWLATPGSERRALTELRRLAELHPGTREAAGALAAIARLKKELGSES